MDEVTRVISSPLGCLRIVATATGVRRIEFVDEPTSSGTCSASIHLDAVENQLDEYFRGKRRDFDLTLEPIGTSFQLAAWGVLRAIPFGATLSYGDQARAMGKPTAVRAVGGANGRNPLAIVVPCHRVVGADGRLTGYASGVERKAWLLSHEAGTL